MSYVHILTVGASLASNYERDRAGQRLPDLEIEDKLQRMREAERANYIKDLLKYLQKKDGEGRVGEASAELNALTRYLDEVSLVYLVHTDTNLGRCCARALREYLGDKGFQVAEPIEIKDLHSPETFQKGLANLVRELARILAHHRDARICATGGFKPEVALASVLGFVAKVPVYYIHESFREEVHLPAIPIDWRYEVRRYGKALDTIIASGEEGIDKNQFIQEFGREAYEELKRSWLTEETEGRIKATEISRAIIEAILLLTRKGRA
jgi:putative CRISPR-associated protein (TIGR02619 family)